MKKTLVCLLVVGTLLFLPAMNAAGQDSAEAWIPGLASFLIPGLGQLLNDELDKAILHFVVDIAIVVGGGYATALLPLPMGLYRYSVVGLAHLGWSLFSGFDAYSVAKEKGFSIGFSDNGIELSYCCQF